MQEYDRRRYKRLPIELSLEVNHIFKQNYDIIDNLDTEVEVIDISKTGIGFLCKAELPLFYYFNAKIKLGESSYFYAVMQIVRESQKDEEYYSYGAEFIGLAPFLANKIDEYERKLQGDFDYMI
jgi:PilZ domain.